MVKKQPDTEDFTVAAERAVDELRRQRGVVVHAGDGARAFFPIEFLDENLLAQLRGMRLRAVITGGRAKSLGISDDRHTPVVLDASGLDLAQWLSLADPVAENAALPPLKPEPADTACRHTLTLAKHASLLPALLMIEIDAGEPPRSWHTITEAQLARYIAEPQMDILPAALAKLPIEGAEQARAFSFRARHGASVHLALVVGDIGDNPLVRVHSSCVTGDILGSLRCDCGDQLALAMAEIIASGSGILLYLHQEGRGIGIVNKLRAYTLQERGVDTYDANIMLGFEEDERDFSIAAGILSYFGVKRARLLTNNPLKIENLEKYGISISERVQLIAKSGRHNHAYMETKAKKSGHLF